MAKKIGNFTVGHKKSLGSKYLYAVSEVLKVDTKNKTITIGNTFKVGDKVYEVSTEKCYRKLRGKKLEYYKDKERVHVGGIIVKLNEKSAYVQFGKHEPKRCLFAALRIEK